MSLNVFCVEVCAVDSLGVEVAMYKGAAQPEASAETAVNSPATNRRHTHRLLPSNDLHSNCSCFCSNFLLVFVQTDRLLIIIEIQLEPLSCVCLSASFLYYYDWRNVLLDLNQLLVIMLITLLSGWYYFLASLVQTQFGSNCRKTVFICCSVFCEHCSRNLFWPCLKSICIDFQCSRGSVFWLLVTFNCFFDSHFI